MNKHIFRFILAAAIILLIAGGISAKEKDGKSKALDNIQSSLQKSEEAEVQTVPEASEETSPMAPVFRVWTGEEINWQVISSGGDIEGSSTNFMLSGTVAQTAVGSGSSDNFGLAHGFWQEFVGEGLCDCIPGDANGDLWPPPPYDGVNVGDAVFMINYVFKGGPEPTPYPICSGDANGDCSPNVGDAVYIINYVFKGGPPPVTCEEWRDSCGELMK